jgi:NitT/TauT family transport system permease protein
VLFLATVAAIWEIVVRVNNVPRYLMPSPSAIANRWVSEPSLFLVEGAISLAEALAGLALGGVLAFAIGVVMARVRWLEQALLPVAVVVKVTPVVVLAPLFVLWFGFGPMPRILIAALLTFFPVLVAAVSGLRAVDPAAQDAFRVVKASAWDELRLLQLPSAGPQLFAAVKVSSTLALLGAVIAEWLGGDRGLGRIILLANTHLDVTTALAGVVTLAVIGIGMIGLLTLLERRWLFWHAGQLAS